MKALSKRQARNCETALGKTCRCRCGGVNHGGMRHLIEKDREVEGYFEALPEDDPHHVRSKEERRRLRRICRLEKRDRDRGQFILPLEA